MRAPSQPAFRCARLAAHRNTPRARVPSYDFGNPVGFPLEKSTPSVNGGVRGARANRLSGRALSLASASFAAWGTRRRDAEPARDVCGCTCWEKTVNVRARDAGSSTTTAPASKIVRDTAERPIRFVAHYGIVKSVPFQMRRFMIITKKALPRRTFLKGVNSCSRAALLDAMIPAARLGADAARPSPRLSFVDMPGFDHARWTPPAQERLPSCRRSCSRSNRSKTT